MKKQASLWSLFVLAALTAAPGSARAQTKQRGRRLLVTFREGTGRAERERAAKRMGLELRDDIDSLQVSVLEAGGDAAPQAMAKARREPSVAAVEEDVYRNWLLESPPSFQSTPLPGFEGLMAALGKPGRAGAGAPADGRVPWGVARVNAPAAWPSGQGEGVKVAVIDTGIDCAHPDLRCDFSAGANLLDPGAPPMDDNEHGTHVSGTIAGRGDGSKGALGVAPKAELIAVKVLDADGAGSLSSIIEGIDWATRAEVDVINMSFGGPNGSAALERAVKQALSAGIVVVAAAGNSGPEPDTVGFPAGYPGVIAVAASDRDDQVAPFSSRGNEVAFIAPGMDILSTVPGGRYKTLSGTSMAAPHVAGLAALAVERGAKGPSRVRRAFASAASKLCAGSACPPASSEGAGMIDAAKIR